MKDLYLGYGIWFGGLLVHWFATEEEMKKQMRIYELEYPSLTNTTL